MGAKKTSKTEKEQDRAEKIKSLQEMIATAEKTISSAKAMLAQVQPEEQQATTPAPIKTTDEGGQVIHGTFDGQVMIGENGKQYPVPANYASKSKLVEDDMLKLTITGDGNFVYKQIGPVERKYLIGIVQQDKRGNFTVKTDEKTYKVLLAAATYFRVEAGDEVTVIVPRDKDSVWGAIENIVRKAGEVAAGPTAGPKVDSITKAPETEPEEENKPSAIERLEKEIETERQRQAKNDTILDEWTPDATALKEETKKPAEISS